MSIQTRYRSSRKRRQPRCERKWRVQVHGGYHALPIQPRRALLGLDGDPCYGGKRLLLCAEPLASMPALRQAYLDWLAAHEAHWLAHGRVTAAQLAKARELVARYARAYAR